MDIAIIGMSGRFPEAKNISEFYQNLLNGKDSVRSLSEDRLVRTSLSTGVAYEQIGWLDDIDVFDHKLFGISLGEAQTMDPHQRKLLEVVYEAMEDSGYGIAHFRATETAVYASDINCTYYKHAEAFEPTLYTGNMNGIAVGRLARTFDLRGNALLVDTTCSSGLVALHLACNELRQGQCNYAVVCGANFILFPEKISEQINVGTKSTKGKISAFSADADGIVGGEASVCVILKPLKDAIKDQDIIHAVVKGSATNNDANLSGSLTAPSSQSQTEVIKKAWKNAQIDPTTIRLIEAHGTGTKLGDPIEIEALNKAFGAFTKEKQFCAISSLKSNIGHTDSVAGLSSLIKSILSLKHKVAFRSINFTEPNPLIDFQNSAVFVNNQTTMVEKKDNEPIRIGINSFGLAGTNCHVVLEEFSSKIETSIHTENNHFLALSAKTSGALKEKVEDLIAFVEKDRNIHLNELCFTLNSGREHYNYRWATHFRSLDDLKELSKNLKIQESKPSKLLIIVSDRAVLNSEIIEQYKANDAFRETFESALTKLDFDKIQKQSLAFSYSFCGLIKKIGVSINYMVGIGNGKELIESLNNNKNLELIRQSTSVFDADLFKQKSEKLFKSLSNEKLSVLCVGLAEEEKSIIQEIIETKHYDFQYLEPKSTFEKSIENIYQSGNTFNWSKFYQNKNYRRITAPTYPFEKTRCWFTKTTPTDTNKIIEEVVEKEESVESLELLQKSIKKIWNEVLKNENLDENDDFFDIGGHSINGMQILNRIKKLTGLEVEMDDLFENGSIKTLSEFVWEKLKSAPETISADNIIAIGEKEYYPTSRSQKNFWLLNRIEENSTAHNMVVNVSLEGNPSIKYLEQALKRQIELNEVLRTNFVLQDGLLVQKIKTLETIDFQSDYEDLSHLSETQILRYIQQKSYRIFDLEKDWLLRMGIYKVADRHHIINITMHHIVADGWSFDILLKNFLKLYETYLSDAVENNDSPNLQYKDYVAWHEQKLASEGEKSLEYWQTKLAGQLPTHNIIADFKKDNKDLNFSGAAFSQKLSQELSHELKSFVIEEEGTLYMVLVAALKVLLYKQTNHEDIVIGTTISSRTHPDLEKLIGNFLNTLALRDKVKADESFVDLFDKVKNTIKDAYRNQIYPFADLVDTLKIKQHSNHRLLDVGINLHNYMDASDTWKQSSLNMKILPKEEFDVDWDLLLDISDHTKYLNFNWVYNKALFEKSTIEKLASDYIKIIEIIIQSPQESIENILFKTLSLEEKEEYFQFQNQLSAINS